MSVRNKLVKGVFYIGLALFTIVQSYIIGLVLSGALLFPVLAVWSIIRPLPLFIMQKLWLIYLIAGIPVGIAVAVYTTLDIAKTRSKKDKKED